MGPTLSLARNRSGEATGDVFGDVSLEQGDLMLCDLALAEPEMNPHREAPLRRESETGSQKDHMPSDVDFAEPGMNLGQEAPLSQDSETGSQKDHMPFDLASAPLEMNPEQEAPLSQDPETGSQGALMPSDVPFAEPEMNPDQETPPSRHSKTGDSNVDASPEIPMAQTRLLGLQHLPTELLFEIANSLPPSSIIFLSRTCRRIQSDMSVPFELLLGGVPARRPSARGHLLSTPTTQISLFESHHRSPVHEGISSSIENPSVEESNVLRSERLRFLCVLEREHQIDLSRAVCSSCVATHDISIFAPGSLKHQSDKRECPGRAGRMWVCPHWQFTYDEIHSYPSDFRHHRCGATAAHDPRPFVASICGVAMVKWPLMTLPRDQALPSTSQVANALRPLCASACPHFAVNDPFVLRNYSPDCRRLDTGSLRSLMLIPCICRACLLRDPNCPDCGASVTFEVMEDFATGNNTLGVYVWRKGAEFNGVMDPGWIKQLAFPSEFEALERAWNESASRLGPSGGQ